MSSHPPPPDPGRDQGDLDDDRVRMQEEPEEPVRSSPPPDARNTRNTQNARNAKPPRPRYLVVALIGTLLLGAGCWTEGCDRMRLYKAPVFYSGETDPGELINGSIKSDEDRKRADALYQRFIEVAAHARKRAFPLAAGTWVLGAALLALGARGFKGRSNSRQALLQLMLAQAALVVATRFAAADLRAAELDWQIDRTLIHQRETVSAEQYERVAPMMGTIRKIVDPGWLVFRTFASLLVAFALTRPRVRDFFDAADKPIVDS